MDEKIEACEDNIYEIDMQDTAQFMELLETTTEEEKRMIYAYLSGMRDKQASMEVSHYKKD